MVSTKRSQSMRIFTLITSATLLYFGVISLLSTTSRLDSFPSEFSLTNITYGRQLNEFEFFESCPDRYVSFVVKAGLGNRMFMLTASVYVAHLTGRSPVLPDSSQLDEVFDLRATTHIRDICPCYVYEEDIRMRLRYDRGVEELADDIGTQGSSILLSGFFQSWKYTVGIEHRLRRMFSFRPEIVRFVKRFLDNARPVGWTTDYVRVGVHIRRGDMLHRRYIDAGFTTADVQYFIRAMRHFVDRFDRVQFIVCSNDMIWSRNYLMQIRTFENERRRPRKHRIDTKAIRRLVPRFPASVNLTFASEHSPGQDLALLASCDHLVISTGSYGWWAAWLARGTTIYYANWPKKGSRLEEKFSHQDYFPPSWMSMI